MAKRHQKKKSGNKKHGRNKKWCEAYRNRGQREKSKRCKVAKHLERHPRDRVAKSYLGVA